ncbi:OPT oligopeptide transporter [Stereum hirsutum FP-91666 SS1]|uniref:OPT oligopeptide transporter n=1 Tax=Stereum hirsutum (strain FP-91666) TaxID=721885 RepID=UPI000440AD44|nr:OPT oligopeptide transporter [Stereum hirsutum FP-91666 SS1]EIM86534.1 OPT oligopeptide transporter [Stereum hirsutum FP-91666 SS1]
MEASPELKHRPSRVSDSDEKADDYVDADVVDEEKANSDSISDDTESVKVIEKAEEVAIEIISTQDDPDLPILTFRAVFLGIGLSAFGAVLGTIYTFKPQNATVSQLFGLIIAYLLGTAMHSVIPSHGWWKYLNPGPFNIKEHVAITIMASTAANVAVAMEVIAALDLFYNIKLNPAVAIFQVRSLHFMIGYGIAGLLRSLLVYPTYAFYPTYVSVVTLLQSLHFGGLLNHKKRRYFWIVFTAIFFWEWIPQYPFPLLSAISIICLIDNGRSTFVRNLFGAGSSNEGIGLLSFSTSWTLITQGTPLVWPWQTQVNSFIGMGISYLVLTLCYYNNVFNARDLRWMSTSLFDSNGDSYNQTAVLTNNVLDPEKLAVYGLPRYTATYAIALICYNLALGASVTHVLVWHWPDLKRAFGGMRFLKNGQDNIDDPHYAVMRKYNEVPQWWYIALYVCCLALGIGCSYGVKGTVLLPAWSIIVFSIISAVLAVVLGFINATTGFTISVRGAIQIIAAFVHPGKPIEVMYVNLYGNSATLQTLYLLQGKLDKSARRNLKLGQYTKLPPRFTFLAQMAGSIVGSIFNYTMMKSIVDSNREVLKDPVGTRIWSGWIVQQYNSNSVAMGALGRELFTIHKPYWMIAFSIFIGLFVPLPFYAVHRFTPHGSWISKAAAYINTPVLVSYIGWLPFSVNGMWWSCLVIGFISQKWARERRPKWFKKYNYITSAALDGGTQVIQFILSFAVFGASGNAIDFPYWWGNPADKSVDRCAAT